MILVPGAGDPVNRTLALALLECMSRFSNPPPSSPPPHTHTRAIITTLFTGGEPLKVLTLALYSVRSRRPLASTRSPITDLLRFLAHVVYHYIPAQHCTGYVYWCVYWYWHWNWEFFHLINSSSPYCIRTPSLRECHGYVRERLPRRVFLLYAWWQCGVQAHTLSEAS